MFQRCKFFRSYANNAFVLGIIACLTTFGITQAQGQESHTKLLKPIVDAHISKHKKEFDALPRPRRSSNSEKTIQLSKVYSEGMVAASQNDYETTETKLAEYLTEIDDALAFQYYAKALIANKKYIEALPWCAELALEGKRGRGDRFSEESPTTSYTSHVLLALALAEIGDLELAAAQYNFACDMVDDEINNRLDQFSPTSRAKLLKSSYANYTFPVPDKFTDLKKLDRNELIEAAEILYVKSDSIIPIDDFCLARRLMEDAHQRNPKSALVAFYHGYTTGRVQEQKAQTSEELIKIYEVSQSYFRLAVKLAGAKSDLGKLAVASDSSTDAVILWYKKLISERLGNLRLYIKSCRTSS